jgi:GDP-L-fucose synthase
MEKNAKIYVAGHRGLVGSAIVKSLLAQGYTNLVNRSHAELDLTSQQAVIEFFAKEKPEYVFLAAAKVGGIHANNTYPAQFIHENLAIQTNVIYQSYVHGVKRLLFLGSSCIYPKFAPQLIKEEHLLTGALEPTNRPYALAKIVGIEMCWSYNRQYGTQFLAAMPTNLYGPGDNYHPENSHVIPALIRRFHEAKVKSQSEVTIWGTGTPKREFLYSEDMAEACIRILGLADRDFTNLTAANRNDGIPPILNIGYNADISIAELAETIKEVTAYEGKIVFDTSKPDGTMRKLMDSSRINHMGWTAKTELKNGLKAAYTDFIKSNIAS